MVDDETLLRMLRFFHKNGETYATALRRNRNSSRDMSPRG
jgi:hypothetical protein